MKNSNYTSLTFVLLLFVLGCQKGHIDLNTSSILEDRNYTIEKITCDANNRFFDWRCNFYENYLQKDITCGIEKNYIFKFDSDNFNRDAYGFRVNIFVNNIIRFRRFTRDFPFETNLLVPAGNIVSVKTYFEKLPSINEEQSGNVNCKVQCE